MKTSGSTSRKKEFERKKEQLTDSPRTISTDVLALQQKMVQQIIKQAGRVTSPANEGGWPNQRTKEKI